MNGLAILNTNYDNLCRWRFEDRLPKTGATRDKSSLLECGWGWVRVSLAVAVPYINSHKHRYDRLVTDLAVVVTELAVVVTQLAVVVTEN